MKQENSALPRGWSEALFGSINEFRSKSIKPSEYLGETFELWSVPSFVTGKPEIKTGEEIGSTKQQVQHKDVLVCKINPRINRVWQVWENPELRQIASSEWIVFRSSILDSTYLKFFFSSPQFRSLICSDVTGIGGSLMRAQPKRVASFPVPISPLNEQKRIANKLDSLMSRIRSCQSRCDRIPSILKNFRQSVFDAASSGEIIEGNESSNLSDVDNRKSDSVNPNWETSLLGDILVGKPRNGYSPRPVDYETETRSLTLTATTSGQFNANYFKYIDEKIPRDSYLWLEPGDILIQRANSIEYVGVSAVYDGLPHSFIYPDLMMKCKVNEEKILPKFLHCLLSSSKVRTYFRSKATGTAGNMPKINQKIVMAAPVCFPSVQLQAEIIRQVDSLFAFANRLEFRYQIARESIDNLSPSLLTKAFQGELVSQNPNDEPASTLLETIQKIEIKPSDQKRKKTMSSGSQIPKNLHEQIYEEFGRRKFDASLLLEFKGWDLAASHEELFELLDKGLLVMSRKSNDFGYHLKCVSRPS